MTVLGSDDSRLHHGQGMGPAIQALLGVMGRDLVPPEDRRRIMDVAAAIPAALARNSFGVELRADAPDGGPVDLCVAMTRQEVADPACVAADGPWRRLWSDEAWGRVVQTIEAWRGGMFPQLRDLLLEFDTGTAGARDAGVFTAPVDLADETPERAPTNCFHADPSVGFAPLCSLSGEIGPGIHATFRRLLGRLPPWAEVFQAGRMIGRAEGAETLRVVIRRLRPDAIPPLLAEEMDPAVRDQVLGSILPLSDRLQRAGGALALSVDLTPAGISPRVGIEINDDARFYMGRPGAWPQFFELMGEAGAAHPRLAESVLRAVGRHRLFARIPAAAILVGISHAKLLPAAGRSAAKIYLGARLWHGAQE